MEQVFSAGVGRADITPELGTQMFGYTPTRPCTSIHDGLNVTVFLIEQDGRRYAIAAADLCVVRGKVSDDVRQAIADAVDTEFDRVILSTIHTHSGPVMNVDEDGNSMNPEYHYGVLVPRAAEAAKAALAALQPAELGIGVTMSNVGINRRHIRPDGTVELGQEPLGLYDPRMTVVSLRNAETKQVIGNMVHYGCHNTASGKNSEVTRDWCGVMIDRMEKELGGITAFFNGCQGDCGPRLPNGKTTGNLQMAMELGGIAGIDGMRAWRSIREWRDEIDVRSAATIVKLPYEKAMSEEEIRRQLIPYEDPEYREKNRMFYGGLQRKLKLLESGKADEQFMELRTCAIALGPIAIMPIPFETFSQITMRITRESPFPYTICLSNGNGGNSYFPSQDQLCMGGYEIKAFKIYRAHPLTDNADQALISQDVALLSALWEQEGPC